MFFSPFHHRKTGWPGRWHSNSGNAPKDIATLCTRGCAWFFFFLTSARAFFILTRKRPSPWQQGLLAPTTAGTAGSKGENKILNFFYFHYWGWGDLSITHSFYCSNRRGGGGGGKVCGVVKCCVCVFRQWDGQELWQKEDAARILNWYGKLRSNTDQSSWGIRAYSAYIHYNPTCMHMPFHEQQNVFPTGSLYSLIKLFIYN